MEYVAIRIIKFDSRNGYSLVFYWSLSFYMCGQTAYGLFTFIVILRKNYKILAFNILDRIYDIKLCTNSHVKYYFESIQFQSMFIIDNTAKICFSSLVSNRNIDDKNDRIHQMKKNQTIKVVNVMTLHFDVDHCLVVYF